jgi:hypothetical protein
MGELSYEQHLYEMFFKLILNQYNILLKNLFHLSNEDSYSMDINLQVLNSILEFQDYFSLNYIRLTILAFLFHLLLFPKTIHGKEFSLLNNLFLDRWMQPHLFQAPQEILKILAFLQNPVKHYRNVPLLQTILLLFHPLIYQLYHLESIFEIL